MNYCEQFPADEPGATDASICRKIKKPIASVVNNSSCYIKCVAWNIGGLVDKLEASDLQAYLKQYDVIILSETWYN